MRLLGNPEGASAPPLRCAPSAAPPADARPRRFPTAAPCREGTRCHPPGHCPCVPTPRAAGGCGLLLSRRCRQRGAPRSPRGGAGLGPAARSPGSCRSAEQLRGTRGLCSGKNQTWFEYRNFSLALL